MPFTEQDYENSIIELFEKLEYLHMYGPETNHDFRSPIIESAVKEALVRLNPSLPLDALNDAYYKITNFENGSLTQKNETFMDYLQNGVPVKWNQNGEDRSSIAYLIDYKTPKKNVFIVANQWTFIENSEKRPDVLLFVNGFPLVLIELKSPSRSETDVSEAYRQIRNYMQETTRMDG